MNRREQIERAWVRANKAVLALDPRNAEKIAFEMGARYADLHPIFEENIPASGPKDDGEILAIVKKLALDPNVKQYILLTSDGNFNPFKTMYQKMLLNIAEGKELFYGITIKIDEL